MAREFLAAITDITDRSRIAALERIIAGIEGEITKKILDTVLEAAGVRAGDWVGMTEEKRFGYHEAGMFYTDEEVPVRFGAVFDLGNERAESWLEEQSSQMITQLTDTQRAVVKDHLLDGFKNGRNPHAVSLDIVGRVGPAAGGPKSGSRTGGIIGLNQPQLQLTQDMRAALSGSDVGVLRYDKDGHPVKKFWIGDDGKLQSVYTRRDHRFDGTILKAIEDGVPLSQSKINRLVSRYSDRLLELRGTTIGRVEALSSMNEAQHESLRQVVDNGYAEEDAVIRIWHHSKKDNARPGHLEMDTQERGLNKPFINPDTGIELMHPNDGPGSESINCRCKVEHKVDFIALEGGVPAIKPKKDKPPPKTRAERREELNKKAKAEQAKLAKIDMNQLAPNIAYDIQKIYPGMPDDEALRLATQMKADRKVVRKAITKEPWEMTKAEYEAAAKLKSQKSFWLKHGNGEKFEVIRNPQPKDLAAFRKETITKYGKAESGVWDPNSGDPPIRYTTDADGNRYYWASGDGLHAWIEPALSRLEDGVKLSQNASNKSSHRSVIRRALYDGKIVPQNVLDFYPSLLDEVRGIKGNKISQTLLLKPQKSFWLDHGRGEIGEKIEVIRNPSSKALETFRKEVRSRYTADELAKMSPYDNAQALNPIIRSTSDADGNKYYWAAEDGLHTWIEGELLPLEGAKLHQSLISETLNRAGTQFGGLLTETPDGKTPYGGPKGYILSGSEHINSVDSAAEWVRDESLFSEGVVKAGEQLEFGVILDKNNNLLDSRSGTANHISYGAGGDTLSDVFFDLNGGKYIHAHPGSAALSPGDISFANEFSISEMMAVGTDYENYYLANEFKKESNEMSQSFGILKGMRRQIHEQIWKFADETMDEDFLGDYGLAMTLRQRALDGDIPYEQYKQQFNEWKPIIDNVHIAKTILINELMAEYGGYNFEYSLQAGNHSRDIEEIMDHLSDMGFIDEIKNEFSNLLQAMEEQWKP